MQFGDMMLNANANANAHAEVAELEYTVEGSPSVAVAGTTLSAVKQLFRD